MLMRLFCIFGCAAAGFIWIVVTVVTGAVLVIFLTIYWAGFAGLQNPADHDMLMHGRDELPRPKLKQPRCIIFYRQTMEHCNLIQP